MTRLFTAHVAVHKGDGEVEWFSPDDQVPEWAEGQVGDHCTQDVNAPPPDDFTGSADGEDPPSGNPAPPAEPDKDVAPDFTGTAKPARTPRKKA